MPFNWIPIIPEQTLISGLILSELRDNVDSMLSGFTNRCVGNYASVCSLDKTTWYFVNILCGTDHVTDYTTVNHNANGNGSQGYYCDSYSPST